MSNPVTPNPGGSGGTLNVASDVRFAYNKIEGLIGVLENIDSTEGAEEEINKYHSVFSKYHAQYSSG
jgi:hypothetical protein